MGEAYFRIYYALPLERHAESFLSSVETNTVTEFEPAPPTPGKEEERSIESVIQQIVDEINRFAVVTRVIYFKVNSVTGETTKEQTGIRTVAEHIEPIASTTGATREGKRTMDDYLQPIVIEPTTIRTGERTATDIMQPIVAETNHCIQKKETVESYVVTIVATVEDEPQAPIEELPTFAHFAILPIQPQFPIFTLYVGERRYIGARVEKTPNTPFKIDSVYCQIRDETKENILLEGLGYFDRDENIVFTPFDTMWEELFGGTAFYVYFFLKPHGHDLLIIHPVEVQIIT